MSQFPQSLSDKLAQRLELNSVGKLPRQNTLIDFASNDYLGLSQSIAIYNETHQYLLDLNLKENGATGSRLLSGNHNLSQETEDFIAQFHQSESALLYNSGSYAYVGFFCSVPQRNDVILYDELVHTSIREGVLMSNAKSYKFNHNDFEDLEKLIIKSQSHDQIPPSRVRGIYIVTESVFSMDGDCPNMDELVKLLDKYNCYLVIDESHALGVFGNTETSSGEGIVQMIGLQNRVFARIMTFENGLGCHGAVILGSLELKNCLIRLAPGSIYPAGLSSHSVAAILVAYQFLEKDKKNNQALRENIIHFNQQLNLLGLKQLFVRSKSSIQSAIIPGNEKVKNIAKQLQDNGFDVKVILSPTVPEGQERLRFCLHSFNSREEISALLKIFSEIVFKN